MRKFCLKMFIAILGIFVISVQSNLALCSSQNDKKYPIICKDALGPLPENLPPEDVDINSDKLVDKIVKYPWGGSALYINYGNGQYYRVIQSSGKIKVESTKRGNWSDISIETDNSESNEKYWDKNLSTLVDGQLYRANYLLIGNIFKKIPNNPGALMMISGEDLIRFDGVSYKPTFKYCRRFGIYAPYYSFDYQKSSEKRISVEMINSIYIELLEGKFKIFSNELPKNNTDNRINSLFFTELNGDNLLDIIINYYYDDGGSAGSETFAALLLNCGDNRYVYSGNIYNRNFPKLRSGKVKIDGKYYTALVNKYQLSDETDNKNKYDLYIYQENLKEFLHTIAIQGSDKLTFIPLDKKQFEDIVNPPLLRNNRSSLNSIKVAESAISKLIDNYEKSLVNAINTNNFPLVAKYLTPGSNLYKSQKDLVAKLYQKKTREKLVSYKVKKIKTTGQANVYQVYVTEKIGIKRADKADFTVSEFRWVYTVVADGTKYSLSEIAK